MVRKALVKWEVTMEGSTFRFVVPKGAFPGQPLCVELAPADRAALRAPGAAPALTPSESAAPNLLTSNYNLQFTEVLS